MLKQQAALSVDPSKVDNVIFIADKGFYSKLNINTLNDSKLKYIIPLRPKKLKIYSPKDIIEISKSISKIKINGEWNTTETTKKTKELLKKLKIDYLTERS